MSVTQRSIRIPVFHAFRQQTAPMDSRVREAAFEELAREVGPRALAVAQGLLGSRAAAEDAVQEAFERAFRALGRFRGEATLKTWFMRIVVNTCYRHGRHRARFRWVAESEQLGQSGVHRVLSPERAAQDADVRRRIEAALERLSRRQRTVFVLRYVEGLSTEEAAQWMQCAPGTVKATLHHAVRRLQRELGDLWTEES